MEFFVIIDLIITLKIDNYSYNIQPLRCQLFIRSINYYVGLELFGLIDFACLSKNLWLAENVYTFNCAFVTT